MTTTEIQEANRVSRGTRIPAMLRRLTFYSLLAVLQFSFGCQALYFLTPDETKDVKAEYGKIGKATVAVVVWADHPTLDVDPKARRRVCDAVIYEMKRNLPDAKFVPAKKIADFQENSGLDWQGMSHHDVARELNSDLVLRIDLLEYTTRAADTRELRKGRVHGSVSLYDGSDAARPDSLYTTDISATFPPSGEASITDMDEYDLLRAAIEQFGQAVAKKFYDHKESLRGRDAR